jgi:hypothetical protein
MASDSALRDALERLRAAVAAENSQALERERLRLADAGRIQDAFFDLLGAFLAGVRPEPPVVTPPVVTPSVGTAAGATLAQAASLIRGTATGLVKQPSVDGLDFSSTKLEFSNAVVRWATTGGQAGRRPQ